MATIGVPTKLLQESVGHIVTVELKTGQVYRGKLFEGKLSMGDTGYQPYSRSERARPAQLCQAYKRPSYISLTPFLCRSAFSWSILPCYSRRQPEYFPKRHHCHPARWKNYTAGSSVHSRTNDSILHSPRYACKCSYVRDFGFRAIARTSNRTLRLK